MKRIHIYYFFKIILIATGIFWTIKNLLYFIEVCKSLHAQGIATSYLVASTILGSWFVIMGIFLPLASVFLIREEDSFIKLFIKSIGYGLLSIIGSGLVLAGWFIIITWIYG